jgi:hypothetical protein
VIDGKLHHFSAGGLYNGLVLMIDDETKTYWNHITGEAVHGPLKGARVDTWPIDITTASAAQKRFPNSEISISKPPLRARFFKLGLKKLFRGKGFIPPTFHRTMQEKDSRLGPMVQGLGVVEGDAATFYPMDAIKTAIEDKWGAKQRHLTVEIDPLDQLPRATFTNGERPFQLLTRWYGFSFTYPGCRVFGKN